MLIDTVGATKLVTDWTVDPRMVPQIAQSFTLDRPALVTSVTLHPSEISLAKKPEYLTTRYAAEHFVYLRDKGNTGATTVLNIWKTNDGMPFPTGTEQMKSGFNVMSGGYTNVYSHTYDVPVILSQNFTLPFDPAIRLDPGNYLIAWYFQFTDKRIFGVRFWGEVSGHSNGLWLDRTWIPTLCKYDPLPDTSPTNSSAYAADQWASPYGVAPTGPPPGTIGYQTWFMQYVSKTPGCGNPNFGGYNKKGAPVDKKGKPLKNPFDKRYQPMNTGDLDMQLNGLYS